MELKSQGDATKDQIIPTISVHSAQTAKAARAPRVYTRDGDSTQAQQRGAMLQSDEQSLFPSLDDQPFYRDKHLFVHLRHQVVILDGNTIALTRIQYQVLALLVKHAGKVAPRANFLMQIWRHVPELSPRQVDIHINALRRKLGVYANHYIETVTGVGYRFRPMPGENS